MSMTPDHIAPIIKLNKDAIAAIRSGAQVRAGGDASSAPIPINMSEARVLVDLYYTMQEMRKRLLNQSLAVNSGADTSASHEAIDFLAAQSVTMEKNAEEWLKAFVSEHPVYPWLSAVHGIGHVLAAALIAALGGRPVPETVGHWWRYGGYDPSQKWLDEKSLIALWDERTEDHDMRARIIAAHVGRDPDTVIRDATIDRKTGNARPLTKQNAIASLRRIPYNRTLKTLFWKIGDQFVKLGDRQDAWYAVYYRNRKAKEVAQNESGGRADLAKKTLEKFPNHQQRAIYLKGRLPDGRVDLMARRATVKLFVSHLHEIWYRIDHGKNPPAHFAFAIRGHAHYIPPPYTDAMAALKEAA